jgi:hypothetical protein
MRAICTVMALLAAIAVAGCGGGSVGGTVGSSLGPGGSAATAGAPTSGASASAGAGGGVDKALLAAAAGKIATHSTYALHCESGTTLGDETVVVAGGLRRAAVHLTGAGLKQADYVWWDLDATHYRAVAVHADGTFEQETPEADAVGLAFQTACSPAWFWQLLMGATALSSATSVGNETKDGIPSTHFATAGVKSFDIWLAVADGTLVAIESSAGATDKQIVQLSRFDDPSITVQVPTS